DYLGTGISGTACLGNGWRGVVIWNNAQGNTIGGTALGAGNILADNGTGGIWITGAGNNIVQGDTIGLDTSGATALGNHWAGIQIDGGSTGNTVGGPSSSMRNVISGNVGDGVLITSGATGNLIEGDFIGTDASGTKALGNAYNGINIAGAPNNTIGGAARGAGNVISGNGQRGMIIYQGGANGNLVQGNFISTDASGSSALANAWNGIEIQTSGNTIGGAGSGAGNLIAASGSSGILVDSGALGIVVQGNTIGGTAALANSGPGVVIYGNAASITGNTVTHNGGDGIDFAPGTQGVTIGGISGGQGNIISANSGNGVVLYGSGTAGNVIEGNLIGTDSSGTQAMGNGGRGVLVYGGATGNT